LRQLLFTQTETY